MSAYFTYILECSDGTYYTGKTTDLERRIKQHNGELKGGAKYTRIRRPVLLRYAEMHESNSAASKKEYQLRILPRQKKIELCQNTLK